MEDQLLQVLANTQRPEQATRTQAELDLKQAQNDPGFMIYLANIASHTSVATEIRQSALVVLRKFIEKNWSPDGGDNGGDGDGDGDDEPRVPVADSTKDQVRPMLLQLALSDENDRKVKASVSYAVGKIANVDFPDEWPTLLPTLLGAIPTGTDTQLYGALKVLGDIVDESLSEDQFFSMARDIVKVVYDVAMSDNRKPVLRALAVSVFRGCFDLMDMVKEEHPKEVRAFAEEALNAWLPFFGQVLKLRLPENSDPGTQPEDWNGPLALKLQVVKTLIKVKTVFAQLLLPQSPTFFTAVWEELSCLQHPHQSQYIEGEAQGRLEDSDALPYTLDFLVLEELDFLNQCMRAAPVQKELEAQLALHPAAHQTPWMIELMKLTVGYSRIMREEEELWDIDVSLYLAEETAVTANYTARTACGDLLIKLGEWLGPRTLEGLFAHTRSLFTDSTPDWRSQEASLFLFVQVVTDFIDLDKTVAPEIAQPYIELVNYAINQADHPLLRARGYFVAGVLAQAYPPAIELLDATIKAINHESSELVQVACIKAIEGFLRSGNAPMDRQAPMLRAIEDFLNAKDLTDLEDADDLLVTLAESLRAIITMDKRIAVSPDHKALDMMFLIAKHGASSFHVELTVCEAFEDIVRSLSDSASYSALCTKVLPTLTGAFEVASITQDDPLVTMATELLAGLAQHGSEPLPAGFVAATLPKLNRLLMGSNEGEVLRPGAETVKYMLMHDHHQVFGWQDESGRSGLEVCLYIIDRLLGPAIGDNSASEVGGLAAELVEKAGQERLGPYLDQLLRAVANRLATATEAPFIQSLILVFARLSLSGAQDVVNFLSQIQIGNETGLQVVLSKWLENSINFAGYDEIRQNVIALSKLYSLNDPRIAQTQVKGDLIITDSNKIMTRSRTKQNPDQYTIIAAPLKILKVLIEELVSSSGTQSAANAASAAAAAELADDDEGEDGWEDVPDSGTIDLSLGTTKAEMMSLIEGSGGRQRDDETYSYLTDFFQRAANEDTAGFKEWYNVLNEEEQENLNKLAAN